MRGEGAGAPFEPFRRVTIAVADPVTPDRGMADRNVDGAGPIGALPIVALPIVAPTS